VASSDGMLLALKNVLKAKGITYSQIADQLEINETSVKRLMSGHTPMTLNRLEEVCEIVGIDLFDLIKLARPVENMLSSQLTIEQEQALADDMDLFLAFYSLAKGLTLHEILAKYKIIQTQLQKALFKLQKLGLIEILPQSKTKFLVSRTVRWIEKGPLEKRYQKDLLMDFLNNDFVESLAARKFVTFPLSHRSKQVFIRKFRELVSELEEQSQVDLAVEKNLKSTATLLIAMREWTPSLLNR
jgi:transcriptional regulator with XRE-family HTH domain